MHDPKPASGFELGSSRARVLLIDDEQPVLNTYGRILKGAGFAVTAVTDGRSAPAVIAANDFDLVISDLTLPGTSGIDVLRAAHNHDPDLPVVLITGGGNLESAMSAVEYGAVRYLLKPVDPSNLNATAADAVRGGRFARARRRVAEHADGGADKAAERAALGHRFDRALAALYIVFQPIVRWSKREVFAYEALVRTGEASLSTPSDLFAAAEQLHRIHELGRMIRRQVADAIAAAASSVCVFVNLHPCDLDDVELLSADAPLSRVAEQVVLEVTERASLKGVDVRASLETLDQLGFRVAIDDLGAGYSGLSSLTQLHPDVIKLDMSLIRGIDAQPAQQSCVRTMRELCNELGMLVVAEGVETVSERDTVVRLGCDLLQGFLFARPRISHGHLAPRTGTRSMIAHGASVDRGTRVLVVDDDRAIRDALQRGLTGLGYDVSVAANGAAGLSNAIALQPHVIVLDLRMPGMDGHAFLQRLTSQHLDAAVVVASGDGTMDDVIDVMRHGAVDYVRKPWQPGELSAVIARASEIHAERRRAAVPREIASVATPTRSHTRPTANPVFARVLDRFRCGELIPAMPAALVELRALSLDAPRQIKQVAKIIDRDPTLAMRLLQLGYGERLWPLSPVDIVSMLRHIGVRELQTMIETIWVHDWFRIQDARHLPVAARVSRFSLARALAMRSLADLAHHDGSTGFRCGLFADVGVALLFRAIVEECPESPLDPVDGFGFAREHHEEIGAQLVAAWGSDAPVVDVSRDHHAASPNPSNPYRTMFTVATEIAREVAGVDDLTADPECDSRQLVERCSASLGINAQLRARIVAQLRSEFAATLEALR